MKPPSKNKKNKFSESFQVEETECSHVPLFSSVQFSSVAQSCPTLCDPMNRSTPGLPVHHQLPEFTQTHVHWVGDAIQPSHPLSSPSPPTPNPSQHQGLFQWVNSAWGGQSTGVSALASFLPKKSQGLSPSEWTGWISLQLSWVPKLHENRSSSVWKLILCISISLFFFFKVFFFNGPFLKSLLNLLQYCFCFIFCPRTMWDLNSPPGMEPSPPVLEGEVLTTGPPGKSPLCISSSGYWFIPFNILNNKQAT